jgi:hypothetical protein
MARLRIIKARIRARGEDGVATAEYAVATVAACGFGGVLVKLLSSDSVANLLMKALTKAFGFAF